MDQKENIKTSEAESDADGEWQLVHWILPQSDIKKIQNMRSPCRGDEAEIEQKHAEFMKIRIAIFKLVIYS